MLLSSQRHIQNRPPEDGSQRRFDLLPPSHRVQRPRQPRPHFTPGLGRTLLLALLALGTPCLHAEPQPEGWRFHGYFAEPGEEWFSLRNPAGEPVLLRRGDSGAIRVKDFDYSEKLLTLVLVDGREVSVALAEARTATFSPKESTPSDRIQPLTTSETSGTAVDGTSTAAAQTAAKIAERKAIMVAVRKIETKEIAQEQLLAALEQGEQAKRFLEEPSAPQPQTAAQGDELQNLLERRRKADAKRRIFEAEWARGKLAESGGG